MTTTVDPGRVRARLQNIDPYEFEDFVAELWEREGWDTTVSQDSNDMGLDVIAERTGVINQKHAIQAKCYAEGNKVGRPKVQQYYALKEQDTEADAAVVVTTSSFTQTAESWAAEHNVKLVDGNALAEMIERVGAYDLVVQYAPNPERKTASQSSATETTTDTADPLALPDSGADQNDSEQLHSASGENSRSAHSSGQSRLAGVIERSPETYRTWMVRLLGLQVLGLAAVVAGSIGALEGVGVMLWLFSVCATPIVVYADAKNLQIQDAEYQPSQVLWPIATVLFWVLGVGLGAYLLRRRWKL